MSEQASAGRSDHNDPPVDMDWLHECTDGDIDSMKTMVAMYFTQTEKLIAELDLAIGANSAANVKRIAHACAGSSGTCGMVAVARHWRTLEKMGADGKLENAATVASEVKREFERTRKFVLAQGLL